MPKVKKNELTARLDFEAKLWAAADAPRNNMDAAEYKHVVPSAQRPTIGGAGCTKNRPLPIFRMAAETATSTTVSDV